MDGPVFRSCGSASCTQRRDKRWLTTRVEGGSRCGRVMAGPLFSLPSRPCSAPMLRPCRTWLWLVIVLVAEGVVVEHAPRRGRHRLLGPRWHGVVEGVPGDHTGGPTRR